MKITDDVSNEIISLVIEWEPILTRLTDDVITCPKNSQNRSIKQITGHIIDSASNNTHRIIHLQYQPSPLDFPNYATQGNNDRWIAIQDFQNEDWMLIVQHWKYSLLHISHIMKNVNPDKMKNEWNSGPGTRISLEKMIIDFTGHLRLHLAEIDELINKAFVCPPDKL